MERRTGNNGNRKSESGNALWFILLAIALMAALTIAISRSSDTSEQSGDVERARIQASDIMRYGASIRESTDNMRLRGIGESALSFENNVAATSYVNANCTGGDCLVFGSAGGGAYYKKPDLSWLDSAHSGSARYGEWEFSGANAVPGVRSANPELLMYIGYLDKSLCTQINAMLDIAGIPADADGIAATAWQGAFAASATIDNMDGLESGCFEDSTGARAYTFYQVLIKR